jgi:hypothetical protein
MEELTDARMRCDQLKRYVAQAVKMINNSEKRDHFFEVAGNLLYGIPEALFKLDKALDATALAASRLDYEELKQQLKPEKAEELEQVLNEVRIRHIDRRSDPATLLKGKTTMRVFKAASQDRIASALRKVADEVEAGVLHPTTASVRLYRVLMALSQTAEQALQAMAPFQADSREEVMEGFKDANPNLSQAELEEIADQWEKNKNVVKDKSAAAPARTEGYVSVFASDRVAAPRWTPTETKVWFRLPDQDGDVYFFCTEIQKNGGMAGIKVVWPWGRGSRRPQPKAVKDSTGKLFEGNKSSFKKVKEVPDEVREAAKDKGASGA